MLHLGCSSKRNVFYYPSVRKNLIKKIFHFRILNLSSVEKLNLNTPCEKLTNYCNNNLQNSHTTDFIYLMQQILFQHSLMRANYSLIRI